MTEKNWHREQIDREPDHGQYGKSTLNPDYPETLRLYRKFASHPKEPIGQTFTHVAKQLEMVRSRPSRRADLAKMLEAWKFWGEMNSEFRSELLDCIEYTYLKP